MKKKRAGVQPGAFFKKIVSSGAVNSAHSAPLETEVNYLGGLKKQTCY